ncbi:hypothetical protein ACOME3_006496 [Neoechinorhynchus agilis]
MSQRLPAAQQSPLDSSIDLEDVALQEWFNRCSLKSKDRPFRSSTPIQDDSMQEFNPNCSIIEFISTENSVDDASFDEVLDECSEHDTTFHFLPDLDDDEDEPMDCTP